MLVKACPLQHNRIGRLQTNFRVLENFSKDSGCSKKDRFCANHYLPEHFRVFKLLAEFDKAKSTDS